MSMDNRYRTISPTTKEDIHLYHHTLTILVDMGNLATTLATMDQAFLMGGKVAQTCPIKGDLAQTCPIREDLEGQAIQDLEGQAIPVDLDIPMGGRALHPMEAMGVPTHRIHRHHHLVVLYRSLLGGNFSV